MNFSRRHVFALLAAPFTRVASGSSPAAVRVNLDGGRLPTKEKWRYLTPLERSRKVLNLRRQGFTPFSTGGQSVFPVYSQDGGLSAEAVEYWIKGKGPKAWCIALGYRLNDWGGNFRELEARAALD